MKLVSVIIPYYKKKKYIADALKSVLKQTYNNLEILIIYDDPNKEDLGHVNNLCLSDRRIKLIINDKNIGAGKSRNIGIEKSNGQFIAFLDADDEWKSNKIEEQIKFMVDNKIDFSHTSYTVINEKNDFISLRRAKNFFDYTSLIVEQNDLTFNWKYQLVPGAPHSNKVMSRAAVRIFFDSK